MGTWTVSAACGPQVVSTGVSELLTLLVAIQSAALASLGADNANFDPKYYVDLSLKYTLNETQIAFYALPRSGSNVIAPGMYGFKVSAISYVRGYGFVRGVIFFFFKIFLRYESVVSTLMSYVVEIISSPG